MKKFLCATLVAITLTFSSTAFAGDYQESINWAAHNTGAPDCPERYLANSLLAWCLAAGNRSCVTSVAIEAAYRNQDQLAFWLMAEITQCHNSDARGDLYSAERQAPGTVGNYLRTHFARPIGGAADLAF